MPVAHIDNHRGSTDFVETAEKWQKRPCPSPGRRLHEGSFDSIHSRSHPQIIVRNPYPCKMKRLRPLVLTEHGLCLLETKKYGLKPPSVRQTEIH